MCDLVHTPSDNFGALTGAQVDAIVQSQCSYAGFDQGEELPPASPSPSEDAIRLQQAEAERLRGIVLHQEQALRIAGKVLRPYLS